MSGHSRRPYRTRRAAAPLGAPARRSPALPPGHLRALVLAHLQTHPQLDFSPRELARVLGRSHGAVTAACTRLVELGLARRVQPSPQRYQAVSPPQPGHGQPSSTHPDEGTPQ